MCEGSTPGAAGSSAWTGAEIPVEINMGPTRVPHPGQEDVREQEVDQEPLVSSLVSW